MTDKDNVKVIQENYLEYLLNLSQMLNSSLKPDEVLKNTIDSVVEFVRAERGFIMLFDEKGELELVAYKNADPEAILKMEGFSKTIISAAAGEGMNIISVNAQADNRFKFSESVMLTGMRSVMCVPLKVKDKIIGVIYLDNRIEEGMFNEQHLSMLTAFANQAAVAIENARLHENLIKSYDEQIRLAGELHEQEKMRLASEEANRLKSDFVNIVSHELRGPLTVIKTYSAMLYHDTESSKNAIKDDMRQDIYRTVDREVDRLLSIINKMLDTASIDAGRPMPLDERPVDLREIIEEVIKLQSTSKFFNTKKHKIIKEIPEKLPLIKCDREKMTQIIMNLVENALKYSPYGGEVKIKITLVNDCAEISISDQGLGMSEEDLKKVFNKFVRLENSAHTIPGTGLGLYLIKHLLQLHKTDLFVESQPGKGTTFSFTMPVCTTTN